MNVLKYFKRRQAFLEGQLGIILPGIWKSTHLVWCPGVFKWSLKTQEQKARELSIPSKPTTNFQWASKKRFSFYTHGFFQEWEELESMLWTNKSIPSNDLVGFPHPVNCHQMHCYPRTSVGCHYFTGYKNNYYYFFNQGDFRWLLQ